MLFSIGNVRALIVPVLAVIASVGAFLTLDLTGAQGPAPADPAYELSAQVLSRIDDRGRIELCLRTDDGQVVCPQARFLHPDAVTTDRWIASGEIAWNAPIDLDRILYQVTDSAVPGDETGCQPSVERMLSASWKVETSGTFGTAFHIGNGRFITAHHVVDGRPPFVSLIHGDRTIGAAVLGVDPEFDLALLEVETPELVSDVPSLQLRAPTQEDVGQPVMVVGYPGGEALTVSGGGVVIQVWDNNIQTSSAIRGGNSGGPMFDACGYVIGVLWAGGSSWAYTHSGRAVQTSLRRINERWPSWPREPETVPATLRAAGRLIWHYGPEPPQGVDCSELDGDWWLGVSAVADEAEVRSDLERTGWRQAGVCGADGPDDFENGRTYIAALERIGTRPLIDCSEAELAFVETELYQGRQAFGDLRLTRHGLGPYCPDLLRYRLLVALDDPVGSAAGLGATLVGSDGSLHVGGWARRSFRTLGDAPDGLITTLWQEWTLPSDIEPEAVRIAVGEGRWLLPIASEAPERSAATGLTATGLTVEQVVRIVVRVDEESGTVQACLRSADGVECGADGGILAYPSAPGRWRASAPIRWTSALPVEATPLLEHVARPALTCAHRDPDELYAWQFNSLAGSGTAVHVGERQFLVNGRQAPETAPWGVVSRGNVSLPVIRVAFDERNDLALVELFDREDAADLGAAARFGSTGDGLIGGHAHLLSYPSGIAERHLLTLLDVAEVTQRVIRVEPTGIRRHGAPLIDLCSGELLGMSIGGDDLLRAETVRAALDDMRSRAERPVYSQDGPPAHGSAAIHARPLYAGPIQPEFSGRICDVHPSERFDTHYAVYEASVDNPDVWQVYEKDGARPDTCDFGDKIFIVEYRADEEPEAVCIEPRRPLTAVSDVQWELEAPDGIELLLATSFPRDDCPGLSTLEQTRWFSTHYFKLRNTSRHDFDQLTVRVYNEADKRYIPRRDVYTYADSDVWGWRVNVKEGEPVRVVVTVR